jgi:hypothetical protein
MKSLDDMTEPELREMLNDIARAIESRLPEQTAFILLATPFGAHGIAQYVANAHKNDCVLWMKETIARFESGEVVPR